MENETWKMENNFDVFNIIDIKISVPYDVFMQGGYNRESGRKTLLFVGILITLVVIFSVLSLMTIGGGVNK